MTAAERMRQRARKEVSNPIALESDSVQVSLNFDVCSPPISIPSQVQYEATSTLNKSSKRKAPMTDEKCGKDVQLIHDGMTLVADAIKCASQKVEQSNSLLQTITPEYYSEKHRCMMRL